MIQFNGTKASDGADRQRLLSQVQRWAPMIGGAALALLGLSRRSKSGFAVAAAGGLVAYIGANTDVHNLFDRLVGTASVAVNASPEELYSFWLDFEHFPLFMRHIESVVAGDGRRSHWAAIGPLGRRVEWDAEIISQRDNESIAWHSLPGSDLEMEGQVEFRPLAANRGTLVRAQIEYLPKAGRVGAQFAKLLGKDPSFLMRQDLRRLKALIETGEIPTTEGQTHGPRSATVSAMRLLDPDQPITGDLPIKDVFEQQRRAS